MAIELTLILRFEDNVALPTDAEVEDEFDCVVVVREEEEV